MKHALCRHIQLYIRHSQSHINFSNKNAVWSSIPKISSEYINIFHLTYWPYTYPHAHSYSHSNSNSSFQLWHLSHLVTYYSCWRHRFFFNPSPIAFPPTSSIRLLSKLHKCSNTVIIPSYTLTLISLYRLRTLPFHHEYQFLSHRCKPVLAYLSTISILVSTYALILVIFTSHAFINLHKCLKVSITC